MPDIVNLNRARKAKTRETAKAKASENRAAFGRTKAERDVEKARVEKEQRDLEGKRRE